MAHKFDPAQHARLDDPARLAWQPPEVVLGLLRLGGGETVVDYGAGTGVYTLPLAEALPRGRAVAVDRSDELLARLRHKLVAQRHLRTRVEIYHTTSDRVPLATGSVDAVLAVNLWHEIHDETSALTEIMRLLAPDGRLLIVDWAPMARPAGPPNDHVLSIEQATAVLTGMGLTSAAVHQPGELFPYHYAILGRRPDADRPGAASGT
jgi:ubiquinone/menaquinone biosynthesis C-methylase UbiE